MKLTASNTRGRTTAEALAEPPVMLPETYHVLSIRVGYLWRLMLGMEQDDPLYAKAEVKLWRLVNELQQLNDDLLGTSRCPPCLKMPEPDINTLIQGNYRLCVRHSLDILAAQLRYLPASVVDSIIFGR